MGGVGGGDKLHGHQNKNVVQNFKNVRINILYIKSGETNSNYTTVFFTVIVILMND